nr:PREDICTED: fatty acid synthase-like [Bemisia tabaci]
MDDKVEVVISGAAGMFPECKNIPELEEALFSKLHLITDDKRKWKHDYPFSTHCGKAFSHEFFDPMFFNLPFTLPLAMDTLTKRCLEASIEAIIDAGVNPKFLKGSQTAVYATYDLSETELTMGTTAATRDLNVLMGSGRTFSAGRLSYALDLHGPSYTLQGGNGSLYHLIGHAKKQMEQGRIPAAVVVCANFIMTARALCNLDEMGFAAMDGKCRSFDEKAQGYAISDCCVALFLQRASDARRNWATVIGSEHAFFGDKPGSLLSLDIQLPKTMLQKLYSEWNIDPTDVGYIEADGSGIREQDAQEADIISGVFCQNRKNPLPIGSLKSNMGHPQSAACGAGIVKALIALNRSRIPPNINLTSPIPEVTSGGIQVVTDATALNSKLVAVNAIGTAGHFGHILLKQNSKASSTMIIDEKLPQILLLSSRTEAGIEQILHQTEVTKITPEFAGLLNGVFWREVKNHMHRGYTIVSAKGINAPRKVKRLEDRNRPVWWVFSGMGSQWNGMGTQLLRIPIFRDVIGRCDKILRPRGLDIKHILTTDDESVFDNILHSFVGITAVQLGLIEILRALELEPHGMVGHSLGELGCAYADGCLTLEQTILASYARGRASIETDLIKGMMSAVGMSGNNISTLLPPSIDVACQNSASSCTISGPAADVENFVTELKSKGIFAKSVNVGNIAYHSRYIQPASQLLLKYLKEIIPQNTRRSNKWVSTSVPEEDWDSDLARFNSPEYHTNNLLRPVLFEGIIKHIPSNAVLIEIAPHGLLQAVLKRAVPENTTNVSLTHRSSPNGVQFLLEAIGE